LTLCTRFLLSFPTRRSSDLIEHVLLIENRVLTYWRAMHLTSGVSPIVPILLILAGMYLSFWFLLHGLALFGPDRPCLPPKERLRSEEHTSELQSRGHLVCRL